MKTALFHNFTTEDFTGYWNGVPQTFKPGEKKYLPEYLAAHFAKHLTNRELIKMGDKFQNYTSPKFPDQVPEFKKLFDQACIVQDGEHTELETEVDILNKKNNS